MTTIRTLKKIDRQDKLEAVLKQLFPEAKEIIVRGTTGFDIYLPNGFIFQVIKEDYGVSFYIEEQPPQFLLTYEFAGKKQTEVFASKSERRQFKERMPLEVADSSEETDID